MGVLVPSLRNEGGGGPCGRFYAVLIPFLREGGDGHTPFGSKGGDGLPPFESKGGDGLTPFESKGVLGVLPL